MTYRELLESDEWKGKRKIILERDLYKCNKCHNENLITECFESSAYFDSVNNDKVFYKIHGPISEILDNINFRGFVFTNNFNKIDAIQVYYSINNNKVKIIAARPKDDFESLKKNFATIKTPDKEALLLLYSSIYNLKQSIISEALNKKTSDYNWIFVNGLHVHHTYYQLGKNPWEYPDDALITLCWYCHEELHKNTQVSFFDKDGFELDKLNPCLRCFGAGYFPEYSFFHEGVCFRCNGAKYEQLI